MQVSGLQSIPIPVLGPNPEPPKSFHFKCDFSVDTVYEIDLTLARQETRFQSIRTIYYNMITAANDVKLYSSDTQQRITFKAGTQGYVPVLISSGMRLSLTGVSPDIAGFNFVNVDMQPFIWPNGGAGNTYTAGAGLQLAGNQFSIATAGVTSAMLRNSAATSVIGRAANSIGVPGDIAATADGQFLQRSGGTLQWLATIPSGSVQVSASPRLVGRTTAGAGASEEISVGASLTLAALTLGTAAQTGDVTKAANGTVATFRTMNPTSILGNPTALGAVPIDIVAGTNDRFLSQTGGTLSFGQLTAGMVPANTIAIAGLVNATAQYNLIGRSTAGAGSWEQKATSADVFAMLGQANNAGILSSIGADAKYVLKAGDTMVGTLNINSAATTGLHVTQTASSSVLAVGAGVLESQEPGVFGPSLFMYHNSPSPAIGDVVSLRYWFNNSGGTPYQAGNFAVIPTGVTAGNESASLNIITIQNGTANIQWLVGGGIYASGASDLGRFSINAAAPVRTGQYTVATLPSAVTMGAGARAYVTDAAAVPVLSAIATGGGTLGLPVYSDGTNWRNG